MEVSWALGGLGGVQSPVAERRSSDHAGMGDSGAATAGAWNGSGILNFRQGGGRAASLGYAQSKKKLKSFPSTEILRRRESSVFSEGL